MSLSWDKAESMRKLSAEADAAAAAGFGRCAPSTPPAPAAGPICCHGCGRELPAEISAQLTPPAPGQIASLIMCYECSPLLTHPVVDRAMGAVIRQVQQNTRAAIGREFIAAQIPIEVLKLEHARAEKWKSTAICTGSVSVAALLYELLRWLL